MLGIVAVVLVINAALAAWQWYRRERQIQAAWRRLKSSLNLDRSGPEIDRCIELLLREYGLDTLTQPQLTELPSPEGPAVNSAAHYANIAAQRWQITLPPLQFRLLSRGEHRVAGTFGEGYAWVADLSQAPHEHRPLVDWSRVREIQLASDILSDREALPVVVAHEVSHLVLERDNLDAGSPGQNEALTDVATALVGYGRLMQRLRARERRFLARGMALGWSISGPGYLLPEEIDYVMARQAELVGKEGGPAASSEVAT
jgi:hypothetical protein